MRIKENYKLLRKFLYVVPVVFFGIFTVQMYHKYPTSSYSAILQIASIASFLLIVFAWKTLVNRWYDKKNRIPLTDFFISENDISAAIAHLHLYPYHDKKPYSWERHNLLSHICKIVKNENLQYGDVFSLGNNIIGKIGIVRETDQQNIDRRQVYLFFHHDVETDTVIPLAKSGPTSETKSYERP